MQLAEEMTRGAFYVCWRESGFLRIAGTGFIVWMNDFENDNAGSYVVTAKHVVKRIQDIRKKRDVWLVMNSRDGERISVKIPISKWWFHPTDESVDVAVAEWGNEYQHYHIDHTVLPFNMATIPEDHEEHGIREGTEVFMTGVFSHHSGHKRVIPILRTGTIALMPNPDELVDSRFGSPMLAYLVECRSTSQMSGSPAFGAIDRIVPFPIPPTGSIPAEKDKPIIRTLWGWIGLVHGHWSFEESDMMPLTDSDSDEREPLNTGIAVVVPAWKVLEVINHPELEKMRKNYWGDLRKKNAPVEDSDDSTVQFQTTNAPKKSDRIKIPILTRGQFEGDLAKATRKRGKK